MSELGPRLCENSEIQIACRNSVLVSLILEINCTDGLCREKAIENIFLLVLGFRAFSHSLGPDSDVSAFRDDVCFAPDCVAKVPKCRVTNFSQKDKTSGNRPSM